MKGLVESQCPPEDEKKPNGLENVTDHKNISNLDKTPWITGENYTIDDYLADILP